MERIDRHFAGKMAGTAQEKVGKYNNSIDTSFLISIYT
jgi:hypothetical protein